MTSIATEANEWWMTIREEDFSRGERRKKLKANDVICSIILNDQGLVLSR